MSSVTICHSVLIYILHASLYGNGSDYNPSQTKLLRYFFHIMMTSSNGTIFRVTGPLIGEFTGPGEFPAQRPATRSFDVFFDLRLNKRLSKQPWGWWFETPPWSLWRQCNDLTRKSISDLKMIFWTKMILSNLNWKGFWSGVFTEHPDKYAVVAFWDAFYYIGLT